MLTSKPRIPFGEILLFGLWPSPIKKLLYRLRGYRIGRNVSLGLGSVITGRAVVIGDSTSIGFFTVVRGKEIRIGPYVQIGAMTFLDSPYVEIGEGSRINEQVYVGGLQFPDSRFVLGRNCQIMQLSFINPARSIVVGDDSGIGGHSLLFGHTSWLSQFEGYTVDFGDIEIGKSVSLSWRVFVLPHSKIGDGAVIGANSVVHGTIPPRCLAIGFPARVVSKAPDFPKELTADEKLAIFINIVDEMVRFFVGSELSCERNGDLCLVRRPGKWGGLIRPTTYVMQVVDSELCANSRIPSRQIHMLLSYHAIPAGVRKELEKRGIAWIDVTNKERSTGTNELCDEVSQFLKRYGVRTIRVPAAA